jgi:hypothetical protein
MEKLRQRISYDFRFETYRTENLDEMACSIDTSNEGQGVYFGAATVYDKPPHHH